MKVKGLHIVFVSVLTMLSFFESYATLIEVDEELTSLNISPLVEYWGDDYCDVSIDYVLEHQDSLPFLDSDMEFFEFNQISFCPWIKFQITNISKKELRLILGMDNHRLSEIKWYVYHNNKRIDYQLTGDDFEFRQRPIQHLNYLIPINIAPKDTLDCYMSLYRGTHSIHSNLVLQTYDSFLSISTKPRYGLGIFVGIALFFVLGSFVSVLFFKERLVLLYFLMIISMFIFCIRESGIGYQYIWGNGSKILKHILVILSPIVQVVSFLLFGVTYFKTKARYPKIHRCLISLFWILGGLILVGIPLVLMVADSIVYYKLVSRSLIFILQGIIVLAFLLMLVLSSWDFFRERRKESFAFVTVTMVHILFIIAFSLKTMDILWLNFILTYSLFPSFIFEMFMLTFIVFQNYKQDIIEKNELEIKYNQDQVKIANALFEGEEMERQRIASDLHDSLGSLLSISKLYLNQSELKNKSEVENWLEKAQTETRRISNELMPKSLFNLGLVTAIQDLCDRMEKEHFVKTSFVKNELKYDYSDFQKINLYRIVEELLFYAIIESKAKNVSIHLTEFDEQLNFIIEDNGVGVVISTHSFKENMLARVKSLKGEFHIDSTANRGTSIVIDFQLNV